MSVTIKKARPSDAKEMVQLWAVGTKNGNWCYIGSKKRPSKKEVISLQQELSKRNSTTVRFIARDNETNKVVGSAAGSWRAASRMSHVFCCGWGVHPEYQGQGIATALMEAFIAYVKKKGFKRIEAEIAVENIASLKLAKRLGFVKEGVKKKGFLTDDGRYIDMVMVALIVV